MTAITSRWVRSGPPSYIVKPTAARDTATAPTTSGSWRRSPRTISAAPTAYHVMLAVPMGSTTRMTVGPPGQDAIDARKNMAPQWRTRLLAPTTTARASRLDNRTTYRRTGSSGTASRTAMATTTTASRVAT